MAARGRTLGRMQGLVALALALLVACPPQARAQPRGDRKAAAARFQEGSRLYAAGQYEEALVEFQAGYAAFPLPGFQVNIGQCFRKLDRLSQAAEAFKQFLDTVGPDNKLHAEVAEAYSEVKAELGARAEAEAKRQREAEEQRQALLRSIASQPQSTSAAQASSSELVGGAPAAEVTARPRSRSRWWVWTIVGVVAAGAAASAIAVGVVYGQPQGPQPGSLGLLDGRRP